jgi:PAS domain S-box-containing protein
MNRLTPQNKKPILSTADAELRGRAEARLRKLRENKRSRAGDSESTAENDRLFHELQVHQIELEMQNAELLETRGKLEAMLAKYTDLYDFAPVGYMSLDEQGRILEVNLTGAALLGVGRSRLIGQRLSVFVARANRPEFLAFLAQIFAEPGKHVCETTLLRQGGPTFWANIYGTAAVSDSSPQRWCRAVISDITALMKSEEAQRRLEALAEANRELKLEIARRQEVEASLRKSEQHQSQLLKQSRIMQEQLRHLSRQVLQAQEEERKRISRELHDIVAQTLTGINVQLAALAKESVLNPKSFDRNLARTQQLVEKSVEVVHQFARELRPAVLDDLGLIPALLSFMKQFTTQTGVRTHLTAFAGVEQLDTIRRTVLFRVAQEALSNVAKHAQASRVEVCLHKLPDRICMNIKDDGKSFHADSALTSTGSKRLGLLGMRERLEMVGGSINIESAPGAGTTIQAVIPLGKPREKKSAESQFASR